VGTKSKILCFILALLLFTAGISVGYFLPKLNVVLDQQVRHRGELHLGQQGFINPLVDCLVSDTFVPLKQREIEAAINTYVEKAESQKDVEKVSVYFRELNNGPTFGIDENNLYSAASLLKVPILIYYFNRASSEPALLEQQIVYDPLKHTIPGVSQVIIPPPPMQTGQTYSVRELVHRMITYSDNSATAMLLSSHVDLDIDKVLRDMGIPMKQEGGEAWVTVQGYATLFRILYNSTYLTKQASNDALAMLAQVEFRSGLVRGVPNHVKVAHKFGERTHGKVSQLHDCGIVYHPGNPYLLCVMTRGTSFEKLSGIISEISRIVYNHVNR